MTMFHRVGMAVIDEKKLLMVRKKGSTYWQIPGGHIEEGETPVEALTRELREELQVAVDEQGLREVGEFRDRAVDSDEEFRLTLYAGAIVGTPTPSSEIREYMWFDGRLMEGDLPPMFVNHVQPALREALGWQGESQ